MNELLEISGIDYSQGLPAPDGAGDLGYDPGSIWTNKWLWARLAGAAGVAAYLWWKRR